MINLVQAYVASFNNSQGIAIKLIIDNVSFQNRQSSF